MKLVLVVVTWHPLCNHKTSFSRRDLILAVTAIKTVVRETNLTS
jgi:hypothetical protein